MSVQVEKLLADLLAAANGEIVGKIRLQKVVYLLEQLGLNSGTKFSYYHYGPYAEQISSGTLLAELVDGSITEDERSSSYGGKFSVFRLNDKERRPSHVGALTFEQAASYIQTMKTCTSVVLEIAATIHWLSKKEKVANWRLELTARKPYKASSQNVANAVSLLEKLGLHIT